MKSPRSTGHATALRHRMLLSTWAMILTFGLAFTGAESQPKPVLKSERFDRDPGWEGHNNRIVPKNVLIVKQDFGYSATHFAGKAAGEMGGVIQRSTTHAAYAAYAAELPAKTLDDKLTASGSFAIWDLRVTLTQNLQS